MSQRDCFAAGPATPHSAEYSSSPAVGVTIGMLSVVNMGHLLMWSGHSGTGDSPTSRDRELRIAPLRTCGTGHGVTGPQEDKRHPLAPQAARSLHQLPPLAVLAADELIRLRAVRRLHLRGVPLQLLAGAERDV